MYATIATAFVEDLRNNSSIRVEQNRVIVADSSDEDIKVGKKRRRGRPKKEEVKEETIIEIIRKSRLLVQEVKILGCRYNKCIYTNELYDDLGRLVGLYDKEMHKIVKK